MAADGRGYKIEGRVKRDFVRRRGAEATLILQAWMAGYGAEASEMGDAQVRGGQRYGDTTREQYYWMDTGNAQVVSR